MAMFKPKLNVPERQDFNLKQMTTINPGIDRMTDQVIEVRGSRIERIFRQEEHSTSTENFSTYNNMYAVPGLIENHAHLLFHHRHFSTAYMLHGVTTVVDCGNLPRNIKKIRREIGSGKVPGVRYFAAGLAIDGMPPTTGKSGGVASASEARKRTLGLMDQGMDFIKIYNSISPEALKAVCEAAAERNLLVAGHYPLTMRFGDIVIDRVEHLWGVPPIKPVSNITKYSAEEWAYDWEKVTPEVIDSYVKISEEQKIAHTPTLIMHQITAASKNFEELLNDPSLKYLPRFYPEIVWNPKTAPRFFR